VDLDAILCQIDERVVAPDNTVVVGGQVLQIVRQPGRRTWAGVRVIVRQHLAGRLTLTRPPNLPLRYDVLPAGVAAPPPVRRPSHRVVKRPGLGRWPTPKTQFGSLVE
jgi:hypothetical protein